MNEEDEDDEFIKKISISNTSSYRAGYSVLDANTEYTVVAAGYSMYRGSRYIHFITDCGLKLRAGKSLTKIWDKWREQFHDETLLLPILNIDMVEKMTFKAVKKVRVQGAFDIKCKLV
jgi:hypothetical protein